MNSLLRFFVDLSLLRRAPQDLPASPALFRLIVLLNLLVGTAGTLNNFGGPLNSLLANVLDICVILGLLWGSLEIIRRGERFLQAATALLGIGALFGFIVLLLLLFLGSDTVPGELIGLLNLVLLVWLHVAIGHVLRHALNLTLPLGIFAAVGYSITGLFVVSLVFQLIS